MIFFLLTTTSASYYHHYPYIRIITLQARLTDDSEYIEDLADVPWDLHRRVHGVRGPGRLHPSECNLWTMKGRLEDVSRIIAVWSGYCWWMPGKKHNTWPRCCPRRASFLATQPPGFTEDRYCFFVLRQLSVPKLSFSLDRWKNTRDFTLLYLNLRVTKPIQSDLRCERVESRLIRLTHQAKLTS